MNDSATTNSSTSQAQEDDFVTCILTNARSMLKKEKRMYYYDELTNDDDYHIIMLTEPWFYDGLMEKDMAISGFKLVTFAGRKGKRSGAGATALYAAKSTKTHSAKSMNFGPYIQWSQCMVKDQIFATFYRSQKSSQKDNAKLMKYIRGLANKKVVIGADANMPSMRWGTFYNTATEAAYSLERDFTMMAHETGLTQHVTEPTRYDKAHGSAHILDVVLTFDKDILIGDPEVMDEHFFRDRGDGIGGSDHRSVKFRVNTKITKPVAKMVEVFDYQEADWKRFSELVSATRVCNNTMSLKTYIACTDDNDSCIEQINKSLRAAFLSCVPCHMVLMDGSPPWSKPELTKRYRKARQVRRRWKRNRHKFWLKDEWLRLKAKNNRESLKLRMLFEARKVEQMKKDSKGLSKYIDQIKGTEDSVGPLVTQSGVVLYSDKAMAEELADHYVSVNNVSEKPNVDWTPGENDITQVTITPDMILDIIQGFKESNAKDTNDISVALLKRAAIPLAPLIAIIAHRSINLQGKFPDSEKHGIVTPLYKGKRSCRSLPKNYRPITINGTVGKVIETCAYRALRDFLEQNNMLDENQHGFRQKRSTVTHLVQTWHEIITAMKEGEGITLVSLDLQSAFNKILHDKLLKRLRSDGIAGPLGTWFESWVCGRTCAVKVGESISTSRPVTSGIGQGTVLGPLLFIYSVNQCFDNLRLCTRSYADDTSGVLPVKTEADVVNFQEDLDRIAQWADENGMVISVSKCRIQRFGPQREAEFRIKGEVIPEGSSEELLGVTLTTDGRFTAHATKTLNKCYGILTMISRHFVSVDIEIYKTLYRTYISPVMSYASNVWFETDKHMMDLFMAFWKEYWRMTGHDPPDDLMDPIQTFLMNDLLFMKKWNDGAIPIEFREHFTTLRNEASRRLRSFKSAKVVKDDNITNMNKFEFRNRVTPYWNCSHLVTLRQTTNFNAFKRKLRLLIMERRISYYHLPGSNAAIAAA